MIFLKIMKIVIEDLKLKTIIGIKDSERKKKQKIHIDLHVAFDLDNDFSDKIKDTVDYDSIVEEVTNFVTCTSFYTIEKLGIEIINTLFSRYEVINKVKVRVRKDFYFREFDKIYIEEIRNRYVEDGRNFEKYSF